MHGAHIMVTNLPCATLARDAGAIRTHACTSAIMRKALSLFNT
jgi:hypothetical protein